MAFASAACNGRAEQLRVNAPRGLRRKVWFSGRWRDGKLLPAMPAHRRPAVVSHYFSGFVEPVSARLAGISGGRIPLVLSCAWSPEAGCVIGLRRPSPFHSVRPKGEGPMPRKLKTYQTSLGFFELAIAAPSMKAALEAWGSEANLFHQGFAKEADDPAIIAATMARPGIVLRRAVGSNAKFSEHAAFPKALPVVGVNGTRGKHGLKSPAAPPPHKIDDNAAREAAIAYGREQEQRDRERCMQEAAQEAERRRRQETAKAEATLEEARRAHDTKIEEIAAAHCALDRQAEAEEKRWDEQGATLQAALNRARE